MAKKASALASGLTWLEAVAAAVIVGLEAGLGGEASWPHALRIGLDVLVVGIYLFRVSASLVAMPSRWRDPLTVAGILGVLFTSPISLRLGALVALLHDARRAYLWYRQTSPGRRVLTDVHRRPARALAVSFLTLITLGTLLLWFPASASETAPPVSLVDAFFTAVSATCVTGLATLDTATTWSNFGKAVIFVLFQVGGLGIMVISGAMAHALGRRLESDHRAAVEGAFDESDLNELKGLLRLIVIATLGIESIGAIAITYALLPTTPFLEALTLGVFHAVSAFCNAGFSLHSDSLTRYAADPLINAVIMTLIVLGGLGFGVMMALGRHVLLRVSRLTALWRHEAPGWNLRLIVRTTGNCLTTALRFRGPSLPVHARLVIFVSASLIWSGALLYFFFEYDRSLSHLALPEKVIAAFFHSVSARTAGFNTVPIELMHPATLALMIALMSIGASPGSTGGGIKTTTFALALLSVRAYLRESTSVDVFGRQLDSSQVLRSLALFGLAAVTFFVSFLLLLYTESIAFEKIAFETASALGTVGLTLGVTPHLSTSGRIIIAILMFVGRVGPLTAVAAASSRLNTARGIVLPTGRVMVG